MAWTTTKKAQYATGNLYVQHWDLSADSATLELATGFQNVLSVGVTIKSAASAAFKVKANELSAATAANGYVAVTGVSSGDDLFLTVYGN